MARTLKIEITRAWLRKLVESEKPLEVLIVEESGAQWNGTIRAIRVTDPVDESGPSNLAGLVIELTEMLPWTIALEGVVIGTAGGADPAEAVREALRHAEVTSLPEGVEVRASRGTEAIVVFTLDGRAFKVPAQEFAADVARSTRWVQARQAKRHEIDALQRELRAIAAKPK